MKTLNFSRVRCKLKCLLSTFFHAIENRGIKIRYKPAVRARPTRHLLSRTSTGTFKCRTITMLAPWPPHASRPPSRAALPPASTACHSFPNGGSTSRLLCAEPAAPTQIDENEHDGPHVFSESQVVITTDTCPIDSRALGVGGSRGSAFLFLVTARLCGSDAPKKNREVALVRSPRPACCARLLLANQTHIRLSLAVAVGRRTEMHQTTPRLCVLSRTQRPHGMFSLWL